MLIGTQTGRLLYATEDKIKKIRGEARHLGGVGEWPVKRKEHSREHVQSYCGIMKIVWMSRGRALNQMLPFNQSTRAASDN